MNIYSQGDVLRRREEIVRIVRETSVHSQEELMTMLRRRGVQVTQPTLSRDMKELGLAKTPRGYVAPGAITAAAQASFAPRDIVEGRLDQLLRDAVLSAEVAGNFVVIRTPPAAAQPVASAIDSAALHDVLGTVGGDDTIFVAVRTAPAAAAFAKRIRTTAGLQGLRRTAR